MKKGLIYVVFGKEYDKLAAYAIAYSQQFTDLPICVLTNLEKRHSKWKDTKNVNFSYLPLHQKYNRDIKTLLIKYSPFDLSLFLDCDSVIQRKGVDKVFDLMEGNDLLFNLAYHFSAEEKIYKIYKRMMLQVNTQLPIKLYNSAIIGFRKNDQTIKFFELWNSYWKISGRGRDMPALVCAIKNSKLSVKDITVEKDRIWSDRKDKDVIIQHMYKSDFCAAFGIPVSRWMGWKPFNDGNLKRGDWKLVSFK